ncbi:MAG: hypothetical protein KKF78_03460 [Candidatus Omnitrophica bacterium]|nr:hypothetical protein [Candidatus Omnitrophota bacterium]MBU1996196.1 hypothetical protein [Candidatus Omnitrophota bacterium]
MKILIKIIFPLMLIVCCVGSVFAKIPKVDSFLSDSAEEKDKEYNFPKIISEMKALIAAEPENYEHYGKLAFVYDYIGEYEEEVEVLKLEVKYLPNDMEEKDAVYGNLARAYLLIGQIDEAKPWLDKAKESNPNNYYNLWNLVKFHILKNEFQIAAKELKNLDKINTTDRDVYYDAYSFFVEEIKDKELSVEFFREAVKENPESPLSHRALGTAIRPLSKENYEKNMPEALQEFERSLELDPKHIPTYISIADTYLLLAILFGKEEPYQDALNWFDKGYAIEPSNTRLAYAMGTLHLYKGENDKAIEKFEFAQSNGLETAELRKQLAFVYNNKAYALYESGENLIEGLALINKAIELSPKDGIMLGTKAELLYKLGEYREAYRFIKRALEIEPGHEEMNQDLVMIEEALADKKKLESNVEVIVDN